MNRLKYFLMCTVVIGCTMFTACGDDVNNGNNNSGNNGSSPISVIQAQVENGNTYNSLIDSVKLGVEFLVDELTDEWESEVIATGVYTNGGFTLNLPATLPDKYLVAVGYGIGEGVTVSNPNAKMAEHFFIQAYKEEIVIGNFHYGDEKGIIIDDTGFFYVDRDVTITGSGLKDDGEWTYVSNFNLYLKKGWNMMFFTSVTLESKKIDTEYLTTTEPSGLKWYFVAAEQPLLVPQN